MTPNQSIKTATREYKLDTSRCLENNNILDEVTASRARAPKSRAPYHFEAWKPLTSSEFILFIPQSPFLLRTTSNPPRRIGPLQQLPHQFRSSSRKKIPKSQKNPSPQPIPRSGINATSTKNLTKTQITAPSQTASTKKQIELPCRWSTLTLMQILRKLHRQPTCYRKVTPSPSPKLCRTNARTSLHYTTPSLLLPPPPLPQPVPLFPVNEKCFKK